MLLRVGSRVRHVRYGEGLVLSIRDDRTVIRFVEHGERKFLSNVLHPSLDLLANPTPPSNPCDDLIMTSTTAKIAASVGSDVLTLLSSSIRHCIINFRPLVPSRKLKSYSLLQAHGIRMETRISITSHYTNTSCSELPTRDPVFHGPNAKDK